MCNSFDCCRRLELTSVISTVLANISCSARTDRDCSRMKVQMARSGGTFYRAAAGKRRLITGPQRKCERATTKGRHNVSSCLSVGRGLQEAEAVPEALAGQTEFNLLLQNGGGALQNHLVILWTTQAKHSERHLFQS